MRILSVALILGVCLAADAFAYGIESCIGLRSAEKLGPAQIQIVTGIGINADAAAKTPSAFQVASASDADFNVGVGAESVKLVNTEDDAPYPAGWAGPKFQRFTFQVSLPAATPMKSQHRYWIRINSAWISAQNKRSCWIIDSGRTPPEQLAPRHGLRELYVLTPNTLHVITGPGIDLSRLKNAKNIAVSSADDPDFKQPQSPVSIGRRSNLDGYIPDGWPWRFLQRHELFLVFEKNLKSGRSYTVNFNANAAEPVALGVSQLALAFDDRQTLNLAIKVNQCGYLPNADKAAYLGMWMGDLNACDFSTCASAFEVRDEKSGEVVLKGKPALRKKATYKLVEGKLSPDPRQVQGPETVYKQDLSYEDVYQLDLTELKKEGEYYVAIPGMGRSFSFRVAADVYTHPFKTLMNGLFHQRSGMDLKEPWTKHFCVAGHRNKTEFSTFKHGVDKDPWQNLPKFATDGKKHDIWGGHYDAGDWNPRSHLEVAEVLFLLYELNRSAFADGQLNIPENKNGIPDVLDEAHWALDLWTRLQDDDGGVRNGIESNGDPEAGDVPATDRKREFAFAKDPSGSYWFAAAAAQAATIWKGLGREKESAAFLDRAIRAWNWAEKNGGDQEHDRHVFAAAMLLRATGDRKYDEAFRKHSVFAANPKAELDVYNKYNQIYGSFYYATLPDADPNLKTAIVAAFENNFKYWEGFAATTNYRYMRNPHAPNTWGTGGLPTWMVKPAMTMRLTADEKLKRTCRAWILFTNDFSLGCHPLNLVFTVGLGKRHVTSAWHYLLLNTPEGIIPGLQTEGAGGNFIAGDMPKAGGMGAWPGMSLYPAGQWPDLYKYSEGASPGMNEGVTVNMVVTALSYGLMLPEAGAK